MQIVCFCTDLRYTLSKMVWVFEARSVLGKWCVATISKVDRTVEAKYATYRKVTDEDHSISTKQIRETPLTHTHTHKSTLILDCVVSGHIGFGPVTQITDDRTDNTQTADLQLQPPKDLLEFGASCFDAKDFAFAHLVRSVQWSVVIVPLRQICPKVMCVVYV